MKKDTSWGGVANWYDSVVTDENSYQNTLVLPNMLRLMNLKKEDRVLEIACGSGFFTSKFAEFSPKIIGADISKELLEIAKKKSPKINFINASSDSLKMLEVNSMDKIAIILSIQNIENVKATFEECSRLLKTGGKLFVVMNHPAFRIPKASSWQFDEEMKASYRRIDSYMTESRIEIVMNPGTGGREKTVSFHRPFQYYFKLLGGAGLGVTKMEEWISNKVSEEGKRKAEEDRIRKEIPLFMMLEATKIV